MPRVSQTVAVWLPLGIFALSFPEEAKLLQFGFPWESQREDAQGKPNRYSSASLGKLRQRMPRGSQTATVWLPLGNSERRRSGKAKALQFGFPWETQAKDA